MKRYDPTVNHGDWPRWIRRYRDLDLPALRYDRGGWLAPALHAAISQSASAGPVQAPSSPPKPEITPEMVVVALACAYEAVALASRKRLPPLSALQARYRPLGWAILAWLAWHFGSYPYQESSWYASHRKGGTS